MAEEKKAAAAPAPAEPFPFGDEQKQLAGEIFTRLAGGDGKTHMELDALYKFMVLQSADSLGSFNEDALRNNARMEFSSMDTDGDGKVTSDEFCTWMAKNFPQALSTDEVTASLQSTKRRFTEILAPPPPPPEDPPPPPVEPDTPPPPPPGAVVSDDESVDSQVDNAASDDEEEKETPDAPAAD